MTMMQPGSTGADRVMTALIAGLEIEFGRGAGEGLARRFLSAEDAEFRWDARISERWLGSYESGDEENSVLDRVVICGWLDATWFAATMIVDDDGAAHGMLGCRAFDNEEAARRAMADAH
ncbi:hypothetical protein ACFO8O_15875 [Hephaestia sp. GCM10023244]|uniref:hypothetical protein n=1 Tax=unclassified Hephaestia TaxID=2631281 RepID=UPI0020771442|nr:hypothetical protein [Hephaestia sp. MAHUQ-44]MCM8732440.1 hypothetical protein [Hephaestia sp. MAHUQ-44]